MNRNRPAVWLVFVLLGVHGVARPQRIEAPPPLAPMLADSRGAFGQVLFEPFLAEVQELPANELRKLHEAGRADATVQLARVLWWAGQMDAPIDLLQGPAQSGIPVAQYLLGNYLRFKRRDLDGSRTWLLQAAERGHPIAQETVAGYFDSGENGFSKDKARAFQLYLAAGRQGLRSAQLNVGMMLCRGTGTETDKEMGKAWFLNSQQGQRMPIPARAGGCE